MGSTSPRDALSRPGSPPAPRLEFPCTSWENRSFPPLPMGASRNIAGRTHWAARNASRALAAILSSRGTPDAMMFRLAVFDKVWEINRSQWRSRIKEGKFRLFSEWMAHVDRIIADVYAAAETVLERIGWTPPPFDKVRLFCRAAMDVASDRMFDGHIVDVQRQTYRPSVLGRFDPDLYNRAEFANYRTIGARFGRDGVVIEELYVPEEELEWDEIKGGWRYREESEEDEEDEEESSCEQVAMS